jgi:hypothetical protein
MPCPNKRGDEINYLISIIDTCEDHLKVEVNPSHTGRIFACDIDPEEGFKEGRLKQPRAKRPKLACILRLSLDVF